MVQIHGWAVDEEDMSVFDTVLVSVNGKTYECEVIERPDVSGYFGDSKLANAGFGVEVHKSLFEAGENELDFILIRDGQRVFYKEYFVVNVRSISK
jgi:hypothetical protein